MEAASTSFFIFSPNELQSDIEKMTTSNQIPAAWLSPGCDSARNLRWRFWGKKSPQLRQTHTLAWLAKTGTAGPCQKKKPRLMPGLSLEDIFDDQYFATTGAPNL
jgi:hypothetical protein